MERKRRRAEFVMSQNSSGGESTPQQAKRDSSKVGRNDPCPCGSGKKFKKCHGVNV